MTTAGYRRPSSGQRGRSIPALAPASAVTRLSATGADAYLAEVENWFIHLGTSLSPNTVASYRQSVAQFARWMVGAGRDLDPRVITRRDVVDYLAALAAEGLAPSTQLTRFVGLSMFFRFLASPEEGVINRSPCEGIKGPRQPRGIPAKTIDHDDIRALLATTAGRTFAARRDRALILLLTDTGARRSEVAGILLSEAGAEAGDLNLPERWIRLHGKGGKTRRVGFGPDTAEALRLYLRARRDHPRADAIMDVAAFVGQRRRGQPLFLSEQGTGHRGHLSGGGLAQMLDRRCAQAGIAPIHPHQFRHTWADASLAGGMNEGDVMQLAGWSRRDMLDRYGRDRAAARALAHYQSPVEAIVGKGPKR